MKKFAILISILIVAVSLIGCVSSDPYPEDMYSRGNYYTWNGTAWVALIGTVNETDPKFTSSNASGITAINIANWNTAYNNRVDTWLGALHFNIGNTVSISSANATDDGQLLATDWVKFNDKVSPAYGQLYNDEASANITVVSAGTYYKVTGWSAGLSYLTSLSTANSTITISIGGSGVYLVTVNVGVSNSGVNRTMHIAVFKNTAEQTNIDMEMKTLSAGDLISFGTNGILNLATGDVIELRVTSSTNGDVATFNHASLTITRIG